MPGTIYSWRLHQLPSGWFEVVVIGGGDQITLKKGRTPGKALDSLALWAEKRNVEVTFSGVMLESGQNS